MLDELIASFDHSEAVTLPEYAAASKAIDDLAHVLPRHVTRERFVEMVREMAVALIYPDKCRACVAAHNGIRITAPYGAEVNGGNVRGAYRCTACGARWRCSTSTTHLDHPL